MTEEDKIKNADNIYKDLVTYAKIKYFLTQNKDLIYFKSFDDIEEYISSSNFKKNNSKIVRDLNVYYKIQKFLNKKRLVFFKDLDEVEEYILSNKEFINPIILNPTKESIKELRYDSYTPTQKEKICKNCGKPFSSYVSQSRFCSISCRNKYRRNHKEY
jgi:hypothetical protein